MLSEGKSDLSLRSLLPDWQMAYLHLDHLLEVALRYVDRWPVLPVVSRGRFQQARRSDLETKTFSRVVGFSEK
jgi:hypothetical protein